MWVKVNYLPKDLFDYIQEVIRKAENGECLLRNHFPELAQGTCATVYAINDKYILKHNDSVYNLAEINDHLTLRDLQGLPLVPTLYAYTRDGRYLIIERIHGETLASRKFLKKQPLFNKKQLIEEFKEFLVGSFERGWIPSDLHAGNVMVSSRGVYIVDYGYFNRFNAKNVYLKRSVECEIANFEDMIDWISCDDEDYNSSLSTTITDLFFSHAV